MSQLPKLPYKYDALEPFIDARTMEIHYTKHHQAYVDKLNAALKEHPELLKKPVEELLKNLDEIPEKIKTAVRNHGGGHYNHSLFWQMLKKDIKLKGKILEEINKNFGSFEKFKEQFINSALSLFGSGWTWLVFNKDGGKLEIINTSNQDSPISQGKIPILGVDVWEHAYYLKYQNKRQEYLEAFFNAINWGEIEKNLNNTKK